jgi:putative acyl-CoA dehydrogenase
MDERFDAAVRTAADEIAGAKEDQERAEYGARRIVERLALVLQGSLVLRHSPPAVAEAFLSTRLGPDAGRTFGTMPSGIDAEAIIERHRPKL